MNSTLPTFLATPAAGSTPTGSAQLNADLAGLLSAPAAPSTGTGEGPATLPADFSTLMPAAPAPAAAAPVVTVQTTIIPPAEIPPVVTVAMPVRRFTSGPMGKPVAPGSSDPVLAKAPNWSRSDLAADGGQSTAGSPLLQEVIAPESMSSSTGAKAPRLQDEAVPAPAEVPPEIREQAVAFVASLLQSLLPETTLPSLPTPDSTPLGQQATAPLPASVPEGKVSPLMAPLAVEPVAPLKGSMPNSAAGADLQSHTSHRSDGLSSVEAVPASPVEKGTTPSAPATVAAATPAPSFTVTRDGSLEFKLTPPAASALPKSADSAATREPTEPVEFSAELTIPGQPVVRVESAGFSADDIAPAMAVTAPASAPEKFAAKNRAQKSPRVSTSDAGERNFVFTVDKQVTDSAPRTGIAVAQTGTTMLAAPTEEIRAVRSPQDSTVSPMRADFQAAQPPAERITAPVAAPSGQNFAERAVDTVTGLIEAQFSASMQKSGSVQLRLKFGGEDLSVRVEIRDGAVHTAFRTDSPALRAALEQEWRAVASASPEQMQRYAEPVFAPGSASPSNSSTAQGDAQRQPNQQAQSDAQHRGAREAFADHPVFNRRSLVGESFAPEPVAPRVATFLPTSLRLSALA